MTEPKRWSSPDSDVDPVLRSVLRYGRELGPTSAQLGAIVAGATEPARSASARRKPRALWSIAAVAAVFVAGAAFAGYAVQQRGVSAPTPAGTPSASKPLGSKPASSPRGVAAPAAAAAPEADVPTPPAVAAAPAAAPTANPAPVRSLAPVALDSAPRIDPSRDAQLLQEARSLVASNPARALSLTRDHELHFPVSALTEERQALQIEALARLGRRSEAGAALASFRTRFPRSIHARRLEALGLP